MRILALALLAAIVVAQAVALPLADDDAQLQTSMFNAGDDEATLTQEVNEAINGVQTGLQSGTDLGESDAVGEAGTTDWGKKAKAEIEAMSKSELSEITNVGDDDQLTQQFKLDVERAQQATHQKVSMKPSETAVEKAANAALKDPKAAAALKADAEKAEMDISTFIPSAASLLQEAPDDGANDLGESDSVGLMSGSDADVAKMINEQISAQVNNQLGAISTNSGDADMLTKFEQDKAQAAEFLEAKAVAKKKAASSKAAAAVKAMLAEAQQHMDSSQELGESVDAQ